MTDRTPDTTRRRLLLASSLAPLAPAAAGQVTEAGTQDVRTPAAGGRLRIAFGSCAKQSKPQPIWQAIAASSPDLFLFLGDNLYSDAEDEDTLRRRYAEWQRVQPLQEFRRRVRCEAIWDDHDYGTDDSGGDYPHKQLSRQLFCDAWNVPADSPRRTRDGVYEAWMLQVGERRVQVILPDLRWNRTPLVTDPRRHEDYRLMVLKARMTGQAMTGWYDPNPDPASTMLGEQQWRWLETQLRQPADLRILGSSVQLAAEGTGWEGWANFPHELERLAKLLADTRAEGTVVISGDMHYADLSRLDVPGGYPLWDLTSSGLTEVWDVPTPNRHRVGDVLAEQNFGLVDVEFEGRDARIALSIRDVQGRERLRHELALSSLRFPTPRA